MRRGRVLIDSVGWGHDLPIASTLAAARDSP